MTAIDGIDRNEKCGICGLPRHGHWGNHPAAAIRGCSGFEKAAKAVTPICAAFASTGEALAYRRQNGGWVFVPDDNSAPAWFDASIFTPTVIMSHPLAKGKNGTIT